MSAAFDFSALSPPFLRNLVDSHIFPPILEWTDSTLNRAEQLYTKNLAQVRDTLKDSEKQSSHVRIRPCILIFLPLKQHHRSMFGTRWNHRRHQCLRMQFPLMIQGSVPFFWCSLLIIWVPVLTLLRSSVDHDGLNEGEDEMWGIWRLETKAPDMIRMYNEISISIVDIIYCHCRPSSEVFARLP